ncbi:MAG TPA: lipid II flippase MurJ, partial [Gammaproteobacteria bacterium]|nr:lipid II flippase MurJ [Gammaproteobacteria bacterium]
SDRLVEFPLGVFGIALATVLLPSLSQTHALKSVEQFSRTLDWALRWVLLIGLPATVGLTLLAGPLLTTLFHYGEFNAHDVQMSTRSLMAFGIGLLAYILIKVLAPAFYARQDVRTPVRIGIIAMLSNMVLNVILVFPLQHAGLALATALSAFLNAGLLYYTLRKTGAYQPLPGWLSFAWRVAMANALMGVLLWIGMGDLAAWLQWGALTRAWHLALLSTFAVVVYLLTLWLLGIRPQALLMKPVSE